MVDWVNPPGSIYCLYYMSGHLRLFTLRPREITIILAGAIKTARENIRIREPDSEDKKRTYKKIPTKKFKITTNAGIWVNKSDNNLENYPLPVSLRSYFPFYCRFFV